MSYNADAIIFDFGGVLIEVDYNATVVAFRELGVGNFDELYSQAAQSNLFDAIETGNISPQRFINEILHLLPPNTSPNVVVAAWNAMIKTVPEFTIELLEKLRSQTKRIFLLSNTNALHIPIALKEWQKVSDKSPYDLFDKVYLSHEIHMRKPNVEIFEYVIKEQGLDPSKTLFIDDSIQHISGAQKAGLMTHHLQSMNELQSLFS